MKTILKSLLAAAILAAGSLITSAQDLPMIVNKHVLKTYAVDQSAQIGVGASTALPAGPDSWRWFEIEGPRSLTVISNIIHGAKPVVDVLNFLDPVHLSAWIFNKDGDPLFGGTKSFKFILDRGGYVLPLGYGELELDKFQEIPIPIDGVTSAALWLKNADGGTGEYQALRVNDGKVYFPYKMAGTNATFGCFIGSKDEVSYWKFWDVQTGDQMLGEDVPLTVKSTIKGVRKTDGGRYVAVMIPTLHGHGENAAFEHTVPADATGEVPIAFHTSEGRFALGVLVRPADTGVTAFMYYEAAYEGGRVARVPLIGGARYWLVPVFDPADLIEPEEEWVPPTDGKGRP